MGLTDGVIDDAIGPLADLYSYEMLEVRYDALCAQIELVWDADGTSGVPRELFCALCDEADELYRELCQRRPWTVFVNCTGDMHIWVEAGERRAHTVIIGEIADPFGACAHCGDSSWRDCSDLFDLPAGPPAEAHAIDAETVDCLLVE